MKKIFAMGFVCLMMACSQNSPVVRDTVSQAEVSGVPYPKLVGRWQFVYDDARRAAVESQLSTPEQKREAAEEAAASTIEFTAERQYISRIGEKEIMRANIDSAPKGLTLKLQNDDTLVMHDPSKGDLIFKRR